MFFELAVVGPVGGLGMARQCLACYHGKGPEGPACAGFGPGCLGYRPLGVSPSYGRSKGLSASTLIR